MTTSSTKTRLVGTPDHQLQDSFGILALLVSPRGAQSFYRSFPGPHTAPSKVSTELRCGHLVPVSGFEIDLLGDSWQVT